MISIFLSLIIFCTGELFAGAGLNSFSTSIFNGKTIEMKCTTYNDCYELLCDFLSVPIDVDTLKPIEWNSSCDKLNKNDNRMLIAYLYQDLTSYSVKTLSDASVLLCELGKNNNAGKIYYIMFNCTL